MRNKRFPNVLGHLLIFTLLLSNMTWAQNSPQRAPASGQTTGAINPTVYLAEVIGAPTTNTSYAKEVRRIAATLSAAAGRNPVLIDDRGYARELVLDAVATQLAKSTAGTRLYRINWNAVFAARDEKQLKAVIDSILRQASSDPKMVIWLDDIASFAPDSAMLGPVVAERLYRSLAKGNVRTLTAATSATFESQIAADTQLKSRFERIDLGEDADKDPFVGDKLSPDLRALVNGADQDRTVKVILQSDDIDNPRLLKVLKENGVSIAARANALDMLVVDLPVRVAEASSEDRRRQARARVPADRRGRHRVRPVPQPPAAAAP